MNVERILKNHPKVKPELNIPTVYVYPNKGVCMSAKKHVGNPEGKGGGIRGKVTKWTTASRRRMRQFMLTHNIHPDLNLVGFTFTIPGPPVEIKEAQNAFKRWCLKAQQRGICAVWRLEVQKRGQLHWHLICGVPDSEMIGMKPKQLWFDMIIELGWVSV